MTNKTRITIVVLTFLVMSFFFALFYLAPSMERGRVDEVKTTLESISKKWFRGKWIDYGNTYSFDPVAGPTWGYDKKDNINPMIIIRYGKLKLRIRAKDLLDDKLVLLLRKVRVEIKGWEVYAKEELAEAKKPFTERPFQVLYAGKPVDEYAWETIQ